MRREEIDYDPYGASSYSNPLAWFMNDCAAWAEDRGIGKPFFVTHRPLFWFCLLEILSTSAVGVISGRYRFSL